MTAARSGWSTDPAAGCARTLVRDAPVPCPFADGRCGRGLVERPRERPGRPRRCRLPARPVVLTDFTVRPFDAGSVAAVARVLAGSCDAVLVGEHQDRPDFPPTLMTAADPGRGRRPVDHADLPRPQPGRAGAGAGRAAARRGGRRAVRDRRRPRPGRAARTSPRSSTSTAPGWPRWPPTAGLTVAVPEAPDAPPRALRPLRLREKQRAGAQLGGAQPRRLGRSGWPRSPARPAPPG